MLVHLFKRMLADCKGSHPRETREIWWKLACFHSGQDEMGSLMLIGAGIAGLLIVSLFFEMLSSSPKPTGERRRPPKI